MANRLLARLKPVLLPGLFKLRNYFNRPVVEQIARLELQLVQQGPVSVQLEHMDKLFARANALLERSNAELERSVAELERRNAQLDRIEQYALASARRVAVNCDPGEVLVRTEIGFVLCPSSDHAVLAGLLEAGELERGTRLLIQRFLKPEDVFIDVGANLGMQTLAAAHAMQGRGRIVAFEPFEPTQRLLLKTIWMNGYSRLVETHRAAVSDRNGVQTLYLGGTSGHHSLFELASSPTPQTVEVPLVRLDSVVPETSRVDLIKIDVEGAELEVLESAKTIIANNPSIALIVEFGSSHLVRTGQSTRTWLSAFSRLGLEHRSIDDHTGELQSWTDEQIEAVESVNLFFARPKSPAWARAGSASI